jgi:hypothetical protein
MVGSGIISIYLFCKLIEYGIPRLLGILSMPSDIAISLQFDD